MQANVQRISPVVMEVHVEVPAEAVKAEVDKAYTTLAKKAHVKGFRPGKAPRPVLEKLFEPQVVNDVANNIVQETLPKALTAKSLTPVSQPQVVEASHVSSGAVFSYKARFEVQPDVETVAFEGFELVRPRSEVTDKMVDEQLENLRRQRSTLRAPEPTREAKQGDVVTIDFSLKLDGQDVKDGGGQGVELELGSGQVLPELDASLVGKNVGDSFETTAKFPENHPNAQFKGKEGTFSVRVTALKERVLPNLDDEFAKELSAGFETIEALKNDIREKLAKALKEQAETSLAEQIVAKLNEQNPLEVPSSLVEQQRRMMEQEVALQVRRLNARFTQQQAQSLIVQLQADAERKVRAGLLMAAIARKHEFKVTDEDIENAYAELAQETGKNVAKVKVEYRDPQRRQILIGMILEDKILDFIETKSVIKDAPADGAEAAGGVAAVEGTGEKGSASEETAGESAGAQ